MFKQSQVDKDLKQAEAEHKSRKFIGALVKRSAPTIKQALATVAPDITRVTNELRSSKNKKDNLPNIPLPPNTAEDYVRESTTLLRKAQQNVSYARSAHKKQELIRQVYLTTEDGKTLQQDQASAESVIRIANVEATTRALTLIHKVNSRGFKTVINSVFDLSMLTRTIYQQEQEQYMAINVSLKNLAQLSNISGAASLTSAGSMDNLLTTGFSIAKFTKLLQHNTEMEMKKRWLAGSSLGGDRDLKFQLLELSQGLQSDPKQAITKFGTGLLLNKVLGKHQEKFNGKVRELSLNIFDALQNPEIITENKFTKSTIGFGDKIAKNKWLGKLPFLRDLGEETTRPALDRFLGTMKRKVFGMYDPDSEFDTSNRMVDKSTVVPFDMGTHVTINEVIPGYLAKILSSVKGAPEIYHDYETGKWMTADDLNKKEVQQHKTSVKFATKTRKIQDLVKRIWGADAGDKTSLLTTISEKGALTPEQLEQLKDGTNDDDLDKLISYLNSAGFLKKQGYRAAVIAMKAKFKTLSQSTFSGSSKNAKAGHTDVVKASGLSSVVKAAEADDKAQLTVLTKLDTTVTEIRNLLRDWDGPDIRPMGSDKSSSSSGGVGRKFESVEEKIQRSTSSTETEEEPSLVDTVMNSFNSDGDDAGHLGKDAFKEKKGKLSKATISAKMRSAKGKLVAGGQKLKVKSGQAITKIKGKIPSKVSMSSIKSKIPSGSKLEGLKNKIPSGSKLKKLVDKLPSGATLSKLKGKLPSKATLSALKGKLPQKGLKQGIKGLKGLKLLSKVKISKSALGKVGSLAKNLASSSESKQLITGLLGKAGGIKAKALAKFGPTLATSLATLSGLFSNLGGTAQASTHTSFVEPEPAEAGSTASAEPTPPPQPEPPQPQPMTQSTAAPTIEDPHAGTTPTGEGVAQAAGAGAAAASAALPSSANSVMQTAQDNAQVLNAGTRHPEGDLSEDKGAMKLSNQILSGGLASLTALAGKSASLMGTGKGETKQKDLTKLTGLASPILAGLSSASGLFKGLVGITGGLVASLLLGQPVTGLADTLGAAAMDSAMVKSGYVSSDVLISMGKNPEALNKQTLMMSPVGNVALAKKYGLDPTNPSSAVMNKIERFFDKLTAEVRSASSLLAGGGGAGGDSGGSSGSAEGVPGDKNGFLKLPIDNDFGVDKAKMFADLKSGSARVRAWLGGNEANIEKVYNIVKKAGMSPELFFAYEMQEQGTYWGWLNHTSYTGDPYGDAASVAAWAVATSKDMSPMNLAWVDGANSPAGPSQDVRAKGNATANSLPSSAIGRMYLRGTAAAVWATFAPEWLNASVNGVANYGDPIKGCMEKLKAWGGKTGGSKKSSASKGSEGGDSNSSSSSSIGGSIGKAAIDSIKGASKGSEGGKKDSGNNQKWVNFARSMLGRVIGSGQCYALVSEYARQVDPQHIPNGLVGGMAAADIGIDYPWAQWGWQVVNNPKYEDIRPGDIINFHRGGRLPGWYADPTWGHTGVVGAVPGGGKFELFDQNPSPVKVTMLTYGPGGISSTIHPPGSVGGSSVGKSDGSAANLVGAPAEIKWKLSESEQEAIKKRVQEKYKKAYEDSIKQSTASAQSSYEAGIVGGDYPDTDNGVVDIGSSSATPSSDTSDSSHSTDYGSLGSGKYDSYIGGAGSDSQQSPSAQDEPDRSTAQPVYPDKSDLELPGGKGIPDRSQADPNMQLDGNGNPLYHQDGGSTGEGPSSSSSSSSNTTTVNNYYTKVDDKVDEEKLRLLKELLNSINLIGGYTKVNLDTIKKILEQLEHSNIILDDSNDLSAKANELLKQLRLRGTASHFTGDSNSAGSLDFLLDTSGLDPILQGVR